MTTRQDKYKPQWGEKEYRMNLFRHNKGNPKAILTEAARAKNKEK